MKAELQPHRFKISLRLVHPSAELSHCSTEFGLEPIHLWKVGASRTTRRGNPLDGFYAKSYWSAPLNISAQEDFESALARIAKWLGKHNLFMSSHAISGGSAELFIGIFFESSNCGLMLDPALLATYSMLGVALCFDMYGFAGPTVF